MTFEIPIANRGFVNGLSDTRIVENGTFINDISAYPHLGYVPWSELQDAGKRMPEIDKVAALQNNYLSQETDWLTFEATVSTDLDQIALAPGYFHYKMDAQILDPFAFPSARCTVKKDRGSTLCSAA